MWGARAWNIICKSVLQRDAVGGRVLQYVAACFSECLISGAETKGLHLSSSQCCSVWQCVAACGKVLQCMDKRPLHLSSSRALKCA